MTAMEDRTRAVAAAVETLRGIEARLGVTREALEAMKPVLIELASRSELFPPHQFPLGNGKPGGIYHLAEDPDGRFALYASAGAPAKFQPPHNHTTWAVIAGVRGEEHNVAYRRTDNGAEPGRGALAKDWETTVRRGDAVAFMPDDFHTIEVLGHEPALHLHMYGRTLEDLPDRIGFEHLDGGAYKRFMAKPHVLQPLVSAAELRAMIDDGEELAILDVREEGVFSRSHLLLASSLPLSHLELRIDTLVPRRASRIVLVDDGDGLAQRAAARLRRFGYRNMAVLAGGVPSWKAAGYELFSGVFVPSKAFGEHVEHRDDTPRWEAEELKRRIDAGEDIVVLDSRPMSEYRVMNIPGGTCCPGAELVHRVFEMAPRPETTVVVNCAGRTRSIIGAQSLINAGIPNQVVALKNGTMGWHLAGLELERGNTRHAPKPGPEALARAREAAARVAQRFGVRRIDEPELRRLQCETARTLYVFDVRSPEEYAAGHLEGAVSAPGGQLVQSTDHYAAVRGARIVLVDDEGVRATMTASWLLQMGWADVFVLTANGTATAPAGRVLGLDEAAAETVAPADLQQLLVAGRAALVDLASSLRFRAGHIPGARFAIRARFAESLPKLGRPELLVLTSPDGVLARLATADAAAASHCPVKVLDGGTEAWTAAGLPLATGEEGMLDAPEDAWYKPYDRSSDQERAMKEYLTWEVALVEQIQRDGTARFRDFPG